MERHRIFTTVVELGGFSAAARSLGMAPSSVARQVGRLEADVGTRLLERTTRKLTLTEHGRIYFDESVEALARLDGLRTAFSSGKQRVRGLLRVSVFESFGRAVVLPVVFQLLREHSELSVRVEFENELRPTGASDRDIYIRVGRPKDSALVYRPLLDSRMGIYASRGYLARRGRPSRPADMNGHSCLHFLSGSHTWSFQRGQERVKISTESRLSGRGGSVVLEAMLAGLGIALLPKWLLLSSREHSEAVELLSGWTVSARPRSGTKVYALHSRERRGDPAIEVLIDQLRDAARQFAG